MTSYFPKIFMHILVVTVLFFHLSIGGKKLLAQIHYGLFHQKMSTQTYWCRYGVLLVFLMAPFKLKHYLLLTGRR